MNFVVDASVFVAASRTDEVHYLASREFLQQVRDQVCNVFCPTLVLPECAAAVARPTASDSLAEELVSLIEAFPGLQLVPVDLTLARRAAQVASDHRLRGADSVSVTVAETIDAVLVAWDAEMVERGADVVVTMTPLEWTQKHAAVGTEAGSSRL